MKIIILFPLVLMTCLRASALLVAEDPYRKIGDIVYTVPGLDVEHGWVEFEGKVLEVQPGGVRLKGHYTGSGYGPDYEGLEFFVANYPYDVAEDEYIGRGTKTFKCAVVSGTYTYPTAIGGSHTIRQLNYGSIYVPLPATPPTLEQIAAAKAKAAATKKTADGKALASNQAAADKGDAYGLLRMGERYRDGDGVAKDLPQARKYLAKAVAAGSPSAQAALDKLPK